MLNFQMKKMSNEEFLSLDISLRSFTNSVSKIEEIHNSVFYYEDSINKINIYFSTCEWQAGPEDDCELSEIAFVRWGDCKYRFYFQIFFNPDDIIFMKGGGAIWSIYKLEIIEIDSKTNEDIKENIEAIICSLKSSNHISVKYVNSVDVFYTNKYFEKESQFKNWIEGN